MAPWAMGITAGLKLANSPSATASDGGRSPWTSHLRALLYLTVPLDVPVRPCTVPYGTLYTVLYMPYTVPYGTLYILYIIQA